MRTNDICVLGLLTLLGCGGSEHAAKSKVAVKVRKVEASTANAATRYLSLIHI